MTAFICHALMLEGYRKCPFFFFSFEAVSATLGSFTDPACMPCPCNQHDLQEQPRIDSRQPLGLHGETSHGSKDDMSVHELKLFQHRFPLRHVCVNGKNWALREVEGSGPILVMLPGAQGTADLYYKVAELLAPLRILLVTPPDIPDPRALAVQLNLLLHALHLDRFHLLGAALFGYVLQLLPFEQSSRIQTLILCNSFCDSLGLQSVHAPVDVVAQTDASEIVRSRLTAIDALPEPAYADFKAVAHALIGTWQSPENLHSRVVASLKAMPAQRCPLPDSRIVIIDCPDDLAVPLVDRIALRKRYRDAPHHEIPGGGHYPAVLAPDAFARVILQTLKVRAKRCAPLTNGSGARFG